MSRRTVTVLAVLVVALTLVATPTLVGYAAAIVDDVFSGCSRNRPALEQRVDRLVEDVPELRLTDPQPVGCDSDATPGVSGTPTTSLRTLDRALADHGCQRYPGHPEGSDAGWSCEVRNSELSIYYYDAPDPELSLISW